MSSLGGHEGIRAVLLLTDGGNTIDFSTLSAMLRAQGINMPSVTQPAVLGSCQLMPLPPSGEESAVTAVARRENAVTYALALGRLTFEDSVKRIAEASGGKFVPLNLNDDLNAVFASIADDLHHEYLLGFSPKTWDGKVHQLEVRLTRSDLTARARQSYLADRTTPAPTATSTSGAAASAPGALLPAAPVLRETPPAQTTAPVPIETPQLPPLSSGDVDAAIKAGLSGKDLHASCTTSGIMSEPTEASVIIEGPVGRIMRAARDAKDRHVAFTAADVTDDMKAPTALVTADLKEPAWRTLPDDLTAPAQTTQHQPWYGTPLRGILLLSAGKELSPTQERAIDRSTTAAKDYVVTATFDLDTVKALIDPKVIVIRRSAAVRHQHEDPGDDPVAWSKGADGAAYGDARTAGTATPSGSPTSRNCRTSSARPGTATGPHLAQRARAVLTC
jgi:hypothetical protein